MIKPNQTLLLWLLCTLISLSSDLVLAGPATQPAGWIRPDGTEKSQPVWGIPDGISVGLAPTPGPRGLIRIYTPYLNQPDGRIEQFIAVEPIVHGQRDLSELQTSHIDHQQGKAMWTADHFDFAHPPAHTNAPARGVIQHTADGQTLSFFIDVEKFDNGAHPIIKLTIDSTRRHEIMLQSFAAADSAPMEACVLTATMGNFSRLRKLHLKDRTVTAADVFHDAALDPNAFFPWREFTDLGHENGDAVFSATGELDSTVDAQVPLGWRYVGVVAQQYWRCKPCPGLIGRVNGRMTFWATHANIPGGVAFENIELKAPFVEGQTFYFGVNQEK